SAEQAAALADGELDFGLLLPPVAGAAQLEHVVVQRERFVVALPARHRLARSRRVAMRALAGEPLVMVPKEIAPGLYDIVASLAARAGFSLNVAQEAIQMQTVVSLVSSGLGAAIVPGSVANLGRRGVLYRELSDAHPRLDVWLAWPRATLEPAAQEFVALARRRAP
ncbi:MAG TPA: LysR family substrate-binding domain-containing protein, partial [Steroidobacteraceae bacterium]